jgi:hypothetical protein
VGRQAKRLPCFAHSCRNTRPIWHFYCEECFERLPGWLRKAIAEEKERCRAAHVFHTQELLRLRGIAYAELKALPQPS